MATLTRSTPGYKDYVNFLEGYKNGKKDEPENSDSGVSVKSFSLSGSTSSSSVNSDVTDFSKNSCIPYNTYRENARNKKFNPVKPTLEKTTKKSEMFIEIQPAKTVSEVSKIFENKNRKSPTRTSKINAKIHIFEKQMSLENKPKIAEKPINLPNRTPTPKIEAQIPSFPPVKKIENNTPPSPPVMIKIEIVSTLPVTAKTETIPPPPPPPMDEPPKKQGVTATKKSVAVVEVTAPPPPPPAMNIPPLKKSVAVVEVTAPPPPPPMMDIALPKKSVAVQEVTAPPPPPPMMNTMPPKMQATLIKGPQVKSAVNNPNGVLPTTIDRNDPMVKKLVYGTLRGLYGAYHDKANDIMATLPRDRVKKSHGVQGIIDQIASNGDLEKLNGRINPKIEQE